MTGGAWIDELTSEERNARFVRALITGKGPRGFLWRSSQGATTTKPHAVETSRAYEAKVDSLRVYRDPCTYCGTRADFGCKHRGVL